MNWLLAAQSLDVVRLMYPPIYLFYPSWIKGLCLIKGTVSTSVITCMQNVDVRSVVAIMETGAGHILGSWL